MNNLSYLLYFADVSDSIRGVFGFLCFIIGFALLVNLVVYSVAKTEQDINPLILPFFTRTLKIISPVFVFFLILSIFSPSKQTVYMIAASQTGEVVIKSPEAKEMLDLLKGRIKKALE